MKTIIQVVQHLRPGGIETMVLDLAAFSAENEQTFIVSLEGDSETAIAAWPRLRPFAEKIIFLEKRLGWQPALVFKVRRLLKRLNADVVHTHHIGPLIYAGIAARFSRQPPCLIHTEHDAWHLNDPRRRYLQRNIIRLVKPTLVADAQTVADAMQNKLRTQNTHIIHNGIDTERFKPGNQHNARQKLGIPQHVPLVGCSGRLEEVKGQAILLDAIAKMPSNTHLALAGIGSTEIPLRQKASRLGLSDRVHFLGRLDDMPTFYQALDVFCLPSFNEGFPLSPLEAQACSIISVVTDVGGAGETLCVNSGRLIEPANAGLMAETLVDVLNHSKTDRYSSPRHFVKHHADVRQMAKSYAQLHSAGG